MVIGDNIRRMREEFETQFEPSGDDRYLYRRNQKGEPIPITVIERDDFIRQYIRRIRIIMGALVAGVLASASLAIWWEVSSGKELPDWALVTVLLTVTVVSIGAMYWVRGAPARTLRGRASIGRERTSEEMRVFYFKKISYGQLAIAAAVGAILVFTRATDSESISGMQWLWFLAGVGLVILAIVQAFRKWIFESQNL